MSELFYRYDRFSTQNWVVRWKCEGPSHVIFFIQEYLSYSLNFEIVNFSNSFNIEIIH
jgi:hypothetical protein